MLVHSLQANDVGLFPDCPPVQRALLLAVILLPAFAPTTQAAGVGVFECVLVECVNVEVLWRSDVEADATVATLFGVHHQGVSQPAPVAAPSPLVQAQCHGVLFFISGAYVCFEV